MTEEMWLGVVIGAGWGLFLGFPLGMFFLFTLGREFSKKDDNG